MTQYIVSTISRGNHTIVYRFSDFKAAYEKYKAILDNYIDSVWLETVYKDTKIERIDRSDIGSSETSKQETSC